MATCLFLATYCLFYIQTKINSGVIIKTFDSILVLILIFIWLILAITYYTSPVFRHSFRRYFTGHQFFIKDVQQHHLRTLFPGGSILLQHVLLTGIMFYSISNSLISTSGRALLFSTYPFITFFGENSFTFFWWGILISLIFETICVLWLQLANAKIKHISQIFNLYPWLLAINILFATIATTVYLAQSNLYILYTSGVLFLLIFFFAFIITSTDMAKFLPKRKRLRFNSYTTILYVVLTVASGIWVAFSPLLNVIQQAISLP